MRETLILFGYGVIGGFLLGVIVFGKRVICGIVGHDFPDLFDLGDDPDLVKWRGWKEDECRRCGKTRKVHFG